MTVAPSQSRPLVIAALGLALPFAAGCATTGGIGRIDPDTVRAIQVGEGAGNLEIDLAPDGAVRKISWNHKRESDVPEAVRRLARDKLPNATVKEYETEVLADGTRLFEVELETEDQRECEVSATADGKLRYFECTLKPEDLPAPIKETVDRLVPGAAIEEAEKQEGPAGTSYSIELKSGGKAQYLRMAQDGTLLERYHMLPATVKVMH